MPTYIIKLPDKDDDTIAKACNTLYNINKGSITYNLKGIQETIQAFEEYDSVFSYASYIVPHLVDLNLVYGKNYRYA